MNREDVITLYRSYVEERLKAYAKRDDYAFSFIVYGTYTNFSFFKIYLEHAKMDAVPYRVAPSSRISFVFLAVRDLIAPFLLYFGTHQAAFHNRYIQPSILFNFIYAQPFQGLLVFDALQAIFYLPWYTHSSGGTKGYWCLFVLLCVINLISYFHFKQREELQVALPTINFFSILAAQVFFPVFSYSYLFNVKTSKITKNLSKIKDELTNNRPECLRHSDNNAFILKCIEILARVPSDRENAAISVLNNPDRLAVQKCSSRFAASEQAEILKHLREELQKSPIDIRWLINRINSSQDNNGEMCREISRIIKAYIQNYPAPLSLDELNAYLSEPITIEDLDNNCLDPLIRSFANSINIALNPKNFYTIIRAAVCKKQGTEFKSVSNFFQENDSSKSTVLKLSWLFSLWSGKHPDFTQNDNNTDAIITKYAAILDPSINRTAIQLEAMNDVDSAFKKYFQEDPVGESLGLYIYRLGHDHAREDQVLPIFL